MEKKSMGSFIAALRKSTGMTQQEVADRLNVSNKTISKWECGEGYPEVMMIPAIAELFGVTSDEILRGERIKKETSYEDIKTGTEKQFKYLLKKSDMKFKNMSFAALALVLLGFVLLYSVSYTFYRPTAGFGLMMVFVIAGCILELIALNNIRSGYEGAGCLSEKGEEVKNYLQMTYRNVTMVFSTAAFSIIAGLPFILIRSNFRDSVITFERYMTLFPFLCAVSLILIWIGRYAYRKNIAGRYFDIVDENLSKQLRKLNKKYILLTAVALILTVSANIYAVYSTRNAYDTRAYGNEKAFFDFISGMDKYMQDRQEAVDSGKELIRPRETDRNVVKVIVDSDKEYFYLVSEYEDVVDVDHEKMTVTKVPGPGVMSARINSVRQGFGILYMIEVFLIGVTYYLKRRKITFTHH